MQVARHELAARLHDGIGQDLILAKMKVDRLKSILPADYAGLVGEISELIGRNIGDARSLIRELSAQSLSNGDFKQTLELLAAQVQAKYRLACVVEADTPLQRLRSGVRNTLFQAVRELLVNAAKHAHASEARIICRSSAPSIRIQVVDNGRGFDARIVSLPGREAGGFGLFSVRARLEGIGANFSIHSRRKTGTTAVIVMPVDATA